MVVELKILALWTTDEMIEEDQLSELTGKENTRKYSECGRREVIIYGISHIHKTYDKTDLDEKGNIIEYTLIICYSGTEFIVPYKIDQVQQMIKEARVDLLSLD